MNGPQALARRFPLANRHRLLFIVVCAVNAALLFYFHNRYWYPTDDGFYAHLAERLLAGEALTRDVQDIHPGYIHAVNVAAMRLFGVDMISLRYPLILAALLQGALAYALLRGRSPVVAAATSIAVTALGVVQFFNPTPNWYCLLLAVAVGCWMTWCPREHWGRLFGAGVLLGLLTMFRQLSGVWAAMGILVVALLDVAPPRARSAPILARAVLIVMLAALLWYLWVSPETEPGGLVLIAVWPVAILVVAIQRVRATNAQAFAAIGRVALGAVCASAPLGLYHLAHGSLGALYRDTVLAGFNETQMPFFGSGWYGLLPIAALYQTLYSLNVVKICNGLYWILLPGVSFLNGVLLLQRLRREAAFSGDAAVPLVAAFYAMVSLYLEGPLYLYYSAGLSLVAVVWQLTQGHLRPLPGLTATALLATASIAVVFHAAQPRGRTSIQILEGQRLADFSAPESAFPRASLRISTEDTASYARLVATIRRESGPDDEIFAFPNDAELYFLAERKNPFRFYNSALGVQREQDLADVLHVLETAPPALVLFRPADKYNNDYSRRITEAVSASYVRIESIEGMEVYAPRRSRPDGGAPP